MNIKKLHEDSMIPTLGSDYSAGYDLYAYCKESVIIDPDESILIGTGIAIELPEKTFGGIFARSGLATKQGLRPSNCVGVVDEDYRGEVKVALYNDSEYRRVVKHGDRIAQLVIIPYIHEEINIVDDINDTQRGSGGFGSTGN